MGTMVGLVLLITSLLMWAPAVKAATSWSAYAIDGAEFNYVSEAVWNTAHNAPVGNDFFDDDIYVGTDKIGGDFSIYSSGIAFPTASIPDDATIESAYIRFYRTDVDYLDNPPASLVVVNGDDLATPFNANDYGDLLTKTVSGGSLALDPTAGGTNTVAFLTLNATGIGWIDATGNTVFGLRLDQDIGNTAPVNNGDANLVYYWCDDLAGGDLSYQPLLVVNYTAPSSGDGLITAIMPIVLATSAILIIMGAWKGNVTIFVSGVVGALLTYIIGMAVLGTIG